MCPTVMCTCVYNTLADLYIAKHTAVTSTAVELFEICFVIVVVVGLRHGALYSDSQRVNPTTQSNHVVD